MKETEMRLKKVIWRLNHMLLKIQWVNDEIKEKIKKYLEINDNENTNIENLRHSKRSFKREIHRDTGLPQKSKKNFKQPNLPPKRITKRRTNIT